ncbi:cytochrome P450 monooxygenase [Fusarium mundagurra]|uniref:Cytochrome P450 monooxygenase n=1 Tax=Fusarium mundagurra TaxID=1567541 RepID=A0A8H6CXH8_9HYPO|nr:cytochrome P450 monooxygenase [Fusarium mundagurra]
MVKLVALISEAVVAGVLNTYSLPIFVFGFIAMYYLSTYNKRQRLLPPGPKGYPLVGNLPSLAKPNDIPRITREWAKKYGLIVYTKMGGADWIWVNSARAAKELMDKRGSKYSSRPRMPMAFEAISNQNREIFMPYGNHWRTLRKLSHAAINFNVSATYKPVQDFESKQVLYEFLHAKDSWAFYDINRRYSASVVMTVTYAHRVADWDDPYIHKIYEVLEHFTLMSEPGKWLIGREWFEYDREVYLKFYRDLVQQIQDGTAPDCFIRDFYEGGLEKSGISEEQAAYAAGGLVEAGSESTSTVINAWIQVCQMYPHVVTAAQEELDRVVGSDRIPTYADEDNLPYIRAMVKETLRFWPITKPGMNHALTDDDWYDGYFIPKGSVVMLNWWAIHYDDNRWEDLDTYDLTRFLSDPYTSAESVNLSDGNLRDYFAYGAGRRICSGMHLAQNSLFINMACTLWAFNIKRAKDEEGKEIEPVIATEPGFLNVPARFQAVFEPWSKKHADIVEKEWLEAKEKGVVMNKKAKRRDKESR